MSSSKFRSAVNLNKQTNFGFQGVTDHMISAKSSLGLFTVAIFGPFSAHFRSHFWIIFGYLAEK